MYEGQPLLNSRSKSSHQHRALERKPSESAGISCPDCGAAELVRAQVATRLDLGRSKAARCLVCGKRFRVGKNDFLNLREPLLGEPYETLQDRYGHMLNLAMRPLHAGICVVGLMLGIAVGVHLALRFDEPLLTAVFLPVTWLGWWIGRWVQPPRENIAGKCTRCRYDLRGLDGDTCPECGEHIRRSANGDK